MNATTTLHAKAKDKPEARLEPFLGDYVAVQLGTELAGSHVVLIVDVPSYLDTLIRELQTVQAAWAIRRDEPVPA